MNTVRNSHGLIRDEKCKEEESSSRTQIQRWDWEYRSTQVARQRRGGCFCLLTFPIPSDGSGDRRRAEAGRKKAERKKERNVFRAGYWVRSANCTSAREVLREPLADWIDPSPACCYCSSREASFFGEKLKVIWQHIVWWSAKSYPVRANVWSKFDLLV